jgi:hypothetical protein
MMEYDIEELAYRAMGDTAKDAEHAITEGFDIDYQLNLCYGVDFDTYCKIVKDLIPFTPPVASPLSSKLYHAFVDVKTSTAIVKVEMEK